MLPDMKHLFRAQELRRLQRAGSAAAKDEWKEVCGFLIWNGFFLQLIPAENRIKRSCGFGFYAREAREIERAAYRMRSEIVGTFHSHPLPGAFPGKSDIAFAPDDSLMLIADVKSCEMRLWRIKDLKPISVRFRVLANDGTVSPSRSAADAHGSKRIGNVAIRRLWRRVLPKGVHRPEK